MGLMRVWRNGPPQEREPPSMREDTKTLALSAKGFLSEEEGTRLYQLAYATSLHGPCFEIGSYCGKSALFLGEGCRAQGRHGVFSVDHHGGSEEQQPGQEYFDPDLYDPVLDRVNTLPQFLANISRAGLEDWVFPIVGKSAVIAGNWSKPNLGLVFIDGGHSKACVEADFRDWSKLVIPGGRLCFHDIYPNPADGGRAPFEVFETARLSGQWKFEGIFGSLGVMRRR